MRLQHVRAGAAAELVGTAGSLRELDERRGQRVRFAGGDEHAAVALAEERR